MRITRSWREWGRARPCGSSLYRFLVDASVTVVGQFSTMAKHALAAFWCSGNLVLYFCLFSALELQQLNAG